MKKSILAMALLLSVFSVLTESAFAVEVPKILVGTVESIECGEMDPFVLGDICILLVKEAKTRKKYGLVYKDYDWSETHIPEGQTEESYENKRFAAATCDTFSDGEMIRALKDHNAKYFYLSCADVTQFSWLK